MTDCRHFPACSGCDLLDWPYRVQLEEKYSYMRDLFSRFSDVYVHEVLPSNPNLHYRHKVQLTFALDRNEGSAPSLILGIHRKDYSGLINQRECRIQDQDLTETAFAVRDWAFRNRIPVWNRYTGRGMIRNIVLRRSLHTGEILAGIVTGGREDLPKISGLADMISERLKKSVLSGIAQNINPEKTDMVLGDESRTVFGKEHITEHLNEFRFRAGLDTFVQVNPYQAPFLYEKAVELIPENSRVAEAYSGIGTLTHMIARKAKSVTAVELNWKSVEAGRKAALENGMKNIRFIQGDAAEILGSAGRADCIVLDPPRTGLHFSMIKKLIKYNAKSIIYISCDPVTLERDAWNLRNAYRLLDIQPVDMFPHTNHIESVACFSS